VRPDGRPLPAAPPVPRWAGPPLAPTEVRLAAAGIGVGPQTATPHGYDRLELAWAIDVLWRPAVDAPLAMEMRGASARRFSGNAPAQSCSEAHQPRRGRRVEG